MRKKTVALMPGDIFAIHRNNGGYYIVLHLASNRFGEAFGLFQGHQESPDARSVWEPVAFPNYVYTGNHFIKTGRWQKVGHHEALLRLFSLKPEIFHSKADNPSNSSIGPHGSAETPEGELRHLSESEATSLGVKQGTYRQIMIEEQFEQYLHRAIG